MRLATRVVLKLKRVVRELSESTEERDFRRLWPQLDSIDGWLLPSEGQWLFNAARSLPDGANIVEIGSYKGRSTCCLALGCLRNNAHIFAIDSFDGGPNLPTLDSLPDFKSSLSRFDVGRFVDPIVGRSTEVAKIWSTPIHLLFVDGAHIYDDVLADFKGFFPHVVPGGLLAFHDVINEGWPEVGRAWHDSIQHDLQNVDYSDSIGYGHKP